MMELQHIGYFKTSAAITERFYHGHQFGLWFQHGPDEIQIMDHGTEVNFQNRMVRFLLQKGEVFGMLEVLNGGNRYTSAIAEDDVQAIAFTRVEYEKNLVANLSFALLNIRIMSKLLRELNLRIKQSD